MSCRRNQRASRRDAHDHGRGACGCTVTEVDALQAAPHLVRLRPDLDSASYSELAVIVSPPARNSTTDHEYARVVAPGGHRGSDVSYAYTVLFLNVRSYICEVAK